MQKNSDLRNLSSDMRNLTGAVKKIQKHFARQGQSVRPMMTGIYQGDFSEFYMNGQQYWVKMNGRGPLVIRTQL